MLTKVKDTLLLGQCGILYPLQTRLKEHRDACKREMMEKSVVAEHVWEYHYPIHWEETGPWQRAGTVGEGGPAHPDDMHPQKSASRDGGAILTNL